MSINLVPDDSMTARGGPDIKNPSNVGGVMRGDEADGGAPAMNIEAEGPTLLSTTEAIFLVSG